MRPVFPTFTAFKDLPSGRWIETPAAVHCGHSGGPVLNALGEIVGWVSRSFTGIDELRPVDPPSNYKVPLQSIWGAAAAALGCPDQWQQPDVLRKMLNSAGTIEAGTCVYDPEGTRDLKRRVAETEKPDGLVALGLHNLHTSKRARNAGPTPAPPNSVAGSLLSAVDETGSTAPSETEMPSQQQMFMIMRQMQAQMQAQEAQLQANEEKAQRQEMQLQIKDALAGLPNSGRPSAAATSVQTAYRMYKRLPAYGAYAHLLKGRDGSFVIDDFLSITSNATLYSRAFEAAGREWKIAVRPISGRGVVYGKGTHLIIGLQLVGGDAIVATNQLAVVGQGKVKKKTSRMDEFKPGDDWDWNKFLALDEIHKGGWLHDGKLVVTASNIRALTLEDGIAESDGSFVIDDFSSITSEDRLYSPPFKAAGREWIIWVDPRGWGAGKGTHLAVVLKLVGGGEIDATYELAVVGEGKVQKKVGALSCKEEETGGFSGSLGFVEGWMKFLALDEIKKGGWLHDGKLVVTATNIRAKVSE